MPADPLPHTLARPARRVALVMIARNEAHQIARALNSARPWVDEMWVLDTGSTDDTVAVARAAGAQVRQAPWPDDFAAARNTALALSTADWHLVLDADEWIASGGECLLALRDQAPDLVGQVRVDSLQGPDGGDNAAPSWISRVLPGPVRYAGRIHEQPQHQLPVRRLPLVLGHAGYLPEALADKQGRNARLLARAVAEAPDDAYLWYQWAKDQDVYEHYDQALDGFDRALALLGEQQPAWLHDLVVRSLHALKRCGRHAEGLQRAEAALATWSHSPDFFFALGDLLLDWAADEPARAEALLPLIESAWQRCLALGEHPELEGAVAGRGSHLAAHNLAHLYELLGQPEAARQHHALAAQR